MRKLILSLALLAGGLVLAGMSSTSASAATGCSCNALGKKPVCVSDFTVCNFKAGGVCTGFCDLPEKKMRKGKRKKKK